MCMPNTLSSRSLSSQQAPLCSQTVLSLMSSVSARLSLLSGFGLLFHLGELLLHPSGLLSKGANPQGLPHHLGQGEHRHDGPPSREA